MKRALSLLLVCAAGCSSPPRLPPDAPPPGPQDISPAGHDARVVALVDGEPVTWRQVVDSAMKVSGRQLIDQYLYLRLRQEFIRRNEITNDPRDVRRRADGMLENLRRIHGDERVKAELAEQGVTEEQYVERFASDPLFAERLLAEKAIVFTMLTEATVEVDILVFNDERDGQALVEELARGTDFEKAIDGLAAAKTRSRVVRWPRRRVARGFLPAQISHLEDKFFRMKDGESTGYERTQTNVGIVARVVRHYPPSTGTYASLKDAIMEEILRSPPGDEQVNVWTKRLFRGSKIQYEDRNSARD